MATVIILSHKAQNPLRANDRHTVATVITAHTFINIITWGTKSLRNSKMITNRLAECLQCYCGEIRQMHLFVICLYCTKAYHGHDHAIGIVEYHRKKLLLLLLLSSSSSSSSLNPTSLPRLEPRTILGFFNLVPVISSSKQTSLFFAPFFCCA
jgi:hypothetical protein